MLNVLGQEVSSKIISNSIGGSFEMDLAAQTEGVYFVEIKAGSTGSPTNSTVKKITVVR